MYESLLSDFQAEYEKTHDGVTVQVEKVGGGTVGKEYVGAWLYKVYEPEQPTKSGTIDTPHGKTWTHVQCANNLISFFR